MTLCTDEIQRLVAEECSQLSWELYDLSRSAFVINMQLTCVCVSVHDLTETPQLLCSAWPVCVPSERAGIWGPREALPTSVRMPHVFPKMRFPLGASAARPGWGGSCGGCGGLHSCSCILRSGPSPLVVGFPGWDAFLEQSDCSPSQLADGWRWEFGCDFVSVSSSSCFSAKESIGLLFESSQGSVHHPLPQHPHCLLNARGGNSLPGDE